MITNREISKLLEIKHVQNLIRRHALQQHICTHDDGTSLLLYKHPCVIEIRDTFHENYLEIVIAHLDDERFIHGGCALELCVQMGFLSLEKLRARNFQTDSRSRLFLSFEADKTHDLEVGLEAVKLLLRLILSKGLCALDQGTFHSNTKAGDHTNRFPLGLKERYLKCLLKKHANSLSRRHDPISLRLNS